MSKNYHYNPNIIGLTPKFNQAMFDKYDTPARKIIKEKLGDFVQDNECIHAQDFRINDKTCKYKFLEIQVCTYWVNQKYSLDYLYLYARKSNYCNETLFLTLSKNMKWGYLFDMKSIDGVKPHRVKKYSRQFVYDIPWNKVMPVEIESLDKETINLY